MSKLEVWQDVEILPCPLCGEPAGRDRGGVWYCDCKPESPDLVECPACAGQGAIYPGATCGMWAGLVEFDAQAETCELCGGEGEVTPDVAAEWEAQQLEGEGER